MLQFTDGDTLNGFFPKGTIGTVQGTYTYANGRKCIPFFERSLQFKKATQLICFKHIIPAFRYVGTLENCIPHGQGIETYLDGSRYFPRLGDSPHLFPYAFNSFIFKLRGSFRQWRLAWSRHPNVGFRSCIRGSLQSQRAGSRNRDVF